METKGIKTLLISVWLFLLFGCEVSQPYYYESVEPIEFELDVGLPKIDDYYSTACQYGAKGGKISGAGGGGFISLIADKKNHSTISSELVKKGLKPYEFNLDSSGTMVYEI